MITVSHGAWHGTSLEFGQWRALVARAAGYEMEWADLGTIHMEVPKLDYTNLTFQNVLGIWDTTPDDILMVLLAHSDEEGAIAPAHAGPLADRLWELLKDGNIRVASYYNNESDEHHMNIERTVLFVEGLERAREAGENLTFGSDE